MLSVNYISNYLCENHKQIPKNIYECIPKYELKNEYEDDLRIEWRTDIVTQQQIDETKNSSIKKPTSLRQTFEILFQNKRTMYYMDNIFYKNKSSVFTFMNSIFVALDQKFSLLNEDERINIVKDFLKKISNDLFERNNYYRFGYSLNRKMSKESLQQILCESFSFRYEEELFPKLQQYIADYLGINIFIIYLENNNINFMESCYFMASYYQVKTNPLLPTLLLVKERDVYIPIMSKENENYFVYSMDNDIIETLWKYFKLPDILLLLDELKKEEIVQEDESKESEVDNKLTYDFKKMKVDELKELCQKHGISTTKKSEKTNKSIHKTKSEMIIDLENMSS